MTCPVDDVLIAMVERTLGHDELGALERHVDSCSSCRELIATLAGPVARVAIATTIGGRYVVEGLLGSGAMGTVYVAHDQSLDRRVALKIHRASFDTARFEQEAAAMARLAHPNVVVVFEVGEFEGNRFVAMELVRGGTLRDWLAVRRRSWREIVELLIAAGDGLAAVHDAGLVHRDFKPENVLVGHDGRPRVSDFGLVRAEPSAPEALAGRDLAMTMTGAMVGTPAYMAPEQFARGSVDARCDQFAFCVTIWEALDGRRPFHGTTVEATRRAIAAGAPLALRGVPAGVRRALARGLAADPAARHADMRALLAALRRSSRPQRARRLVTSALVLVAATVATTLLVAGADGAAPPPPCRDARAQLGGAWSRMRELEVRAAMLSSQQPYAHDAWRSTTAALDRYADDWAAMYGEACAATRVRNMQSADLLDRRMACLSERRSELDALSTLLAAPDPALIRTAPDAARALSAIADCGDLQALTDASPSPRDLLTRVEVNAAERELAQLVAQRVAAQFSRAAATAEALQTAAARIGSRPLLARVELATGQLREAMGKFAEADHALRDAAVAAVASGDELVAARAWMHDAHVVGLGEARYADGHLFIDQAGAALEHLRSPAEPTAELREIECALYFAENNYAEATHACELALPAFTKIDASHAHIPAVLGLLGAIAFQLGDTPRAIALHERALTAARSTLGPSHPDLARYLTALANERWMLNDRTPAIADAEHALAIEERSLGPEHPKLATVLDTLGRFYGDMGNERAGTAALQRSIAIQEHAGFSTPRLAETYNDLADIAFAAGRLPEARADAERAIAILQGASATESNKLGVSLVHLARVAAAQGHDDEAIRDFTRAIALYQRLDGADVPDLLWPLRGIAEIELARHRPANALPVIANAERICALSAECKGTGDDAQNKLLRGEAIWLTTHDRAQVRSLFVAARELIRTTNYDDDLAKLAHFSQVTGVR